MQDLEIADRLMTTYNLSLSTECAAALLSFRYPSTRYIYLSRSTDTARESCFWVVFIKEMWFFLLCGWAIIVNCWYSEWAWSERQRGSSLIELGALNTFLRNARNCDSGKIKGARNCGYARMAELSCAVVWFCALSLLHRGRVYEGEWQFSAVYCYSFDAPLIVPCFFYKLFFVNLVFSVLGSSLLRCTFFHVLSLIEENKDESYRERQAWISNKSLL